MALFSISGVGALTARTTLFNQCMGALASAATHPKIVTIRALYRDPMPLIHTGCTPSTMTGFE